MAAAIACVPSSPTAQRDACRVEITGADVFDATVDPTEEDPNKNYYLTFEKGGEILGQSYVFAVNSEGKHWFQTYIFPDDGSWTVKLKDHADDSEVATQAVTVQALTE